MRTPYPWGGRKPSFVSRDDGYKHGEGEDGPLEPGKQPNQQEQTAEKFTPPRQETPRASQEQAPVVPGRNSRWLPSRSRQTSQKAFEHHGQEK